MKEEEAVWSRVLGARDFDSLVSEIATLKKEKEMLRNQVHVMAAFAHQPAGVHVHEKARMLQARLREHALRTKYTKSRAAAVKIQAVRRRNEQFAKWPCTADIGARCCWTG